MIKFRCRTCQKKIGVKDEYAGRAIKCPGCETRIDIPKAAAAPAAEPTPRPDLAGLAALEAAAPNAARAVESPGRTCPSCDASLSETAVLCINCGHSFQGKSAQIDTQIITGDGDAGRKTTVGGTGKMVLGLGVAGAVAAACSVVWLAIMAFTGYEVGILAWGIGGFVGLTAGLIARNPSPIYCGLTACIAGGSILAAKAVVAAFLSLAVWGVGVAGEFSPENIAVHHVVMQQMLDENAFTGPEADYAQETVAAYFGDELPDEQPNADWDAYFAAWESVDNQVAARVDTLDDAQRQQLLNDASAQHANWNLADAGEADAQLDQALAEFEAEGVSSSFLANFMLTFGLLDIVFFGLAVTTAYSVAYKQGV